jgi:hypothetical protein
MPVPALLAALALALIAAPAASAKPAITSVSFKGTVVRPTIVITGSGFGSRPSRRKASGGSCHSKSKDVGNDYGTNLWLQVTPPGEGPWGAGRSKGSQLDCIGLLAVSWSKTKISFRLGKVYLESGVDFTAGSAYRVGVKGAIRTGRVRFS